MQAGIIPFSTANSSFILDLRLRSMRLWAVFLAIFLPAALVDDGCFFFEEPDAGAAGCEAEEEAAAAATDLADPPLLELEDVAVLSVFSAERGFTWMILRDLVGGGGKENCVLGGWAAEDRLRDLTVSLACTG